MAKIRAVVRDRQNGDPVASEDVRFRQPGGSVITTVSTDVNGMAEYEANGNPYGAISHDTTIGGDTRAAGAVGQRQIGAFFEAELPRSFLTVMSNGYGDGLGDECAVVPGSGRQVIVGTGCCWVQGIPFHFYDDTPLASSANPGTFATRLDRVILRVELDDTATDYGKGVLVYLEGTANNTLPSITEDIAGTYEYVLANVTSASGFSSYTVGNISDQRAAAGPISIGPAVQAALNLKANLAGPTFTGTLTAQAISAAGITGTSLATTAAVTAGNGLTVTTGTVSLPDASLAIADTSGLQAALDTKAATADVNTALAGKVNDTGDTITGTLLVQTNSDPAFFVRDGSGNTQLYVTDGAIALLNSANFAVYSDAVFGSPTFFITGSTGDVHTWGGIEIDGPLNHDGSTVGFLGATPRGVWPDPSDISTGTIDATWGTTEATILEQIRTNVNDIKDMLRAFGLMTA